MTIIIRLIVGIACGLFILGDSNKNGIEHVNSIVNKFKLKII
jgi:hypothetical protein